MPVGRARSSLLRIALGVIACLAIGVLMGYELATVTNAGPSETKIGWGRIHSDRWLLASQVRSGKLCLILYVRGTYDRETVSCGFRRDRGFASTYLPESNATVLYGPVPQGIRSNVIELHISMGDRQIVTRRSRSTYGVFYTTFAGRRDVLLVKIVSPG